MNNLVFLGAAVWCVFGGRYLFLTVKGVVRPNKVTWLLWSIAPMIATITMLHTGWSFSVIPVFMSGFVPFLIFITSFIHPKSHWQVSKFDLLCVLFFCVTLFFWLLIKNDFLTTLFAILSDVIAALPTFLKAWCYPETENIYFYIGGLFSAITSLLAITDWNLISVAFPLYLLLLNLLMIIILLNKDRKILNK